MSIRRDNSFAQVPEWVLFSDVSSNAIRLYAVLWTRADYKSRSTGDYSPSIKTLAEDCRCSPNTVRKAMDELTRIGALTVTERHDRKGDQLPHDYLLVSGDGSNPEGGTSKSEGGGGSNFGGTPGSKSEPYLDPSLSKREAATGVAPPPAEKKKQQKNRGTRIAADWLPSQPVREQMMTELPGVDFRTEHAKFIDHWLAQPGSRGVKLDWDATWRNWMRRAAEFGPPRNVPQLPPPRPDKPELPDDIREAMAALKARHR